MNRKSVLRFLLVLEWLFLSIAVIFIVKNCKIYNSQLLVAITGYLRILFLLDIVACFSCAVVRSVLKYKFGKTNYKNALMSICVLGTAFLVIFIYLTIQLF